MASFYSILFFIAVVGALSATLRKRYPTYYLSPGDDLYDAGGDDEETISSPRRLQPLPDDFLLIPGEVPLPPRTRPPLVRPVAWVTFVLFTLYAFLQMPTGLLLPNQNAKQTDAFDYAGMTLNRPQKPGRFIVDDTPQNDIPLSETAVARPVITDEDYHIVRTNLALLLQVYSSEEGIVSLRDLLGRDDIYAIQVEENEFWACIFVLPDEDPWQVEKQWDKCRRIWEPYDLKPRLVNIRTVCPLPHISDKTVVCHCPR